MAETTKKQKSKAKKIYNIVSTIIVAIIFVFLIAIVAMLLSQKHNGQDSKLFGYYMYDVLTDSMTPTIQPKSVILSKEVDNPEELKVGDIITFTAPSGPLKGYNETHRIVEIVYKGDGTIDYIITEGDKYNPDYNKAVTTHTRDEWHLSPSSVKAKYVRTATFIGGLRNFLSHWYGYVVLIVIPMLIVMALFVGGYVRERAAIAKEEEAEKAANGQSKSKLDGMSDEDKKRLLEEYLKSQNAEDKAENNPQSEVARGDNSQNSEGESTPADSDEKSEE